MLVPDCEAYDTTVATKSQCAQQALLSYVYRTVQYPLEARQNGQEGTVVASFIVEKDSTISSPQIVKDVGGGTGLEVLRVVNSLAGEGVRWLPGRKDGQAVRSRFTLPVRFRLQEAPPYTFVGRDTIYTEFETPLTFQGEEGALAEFITQRLRYPTDWQDSCYVGRIEVQILVRPNGDVRILDLTDYNDLGFDFWYAAVDASTATLGQWTSATYEGRNVPAAYELILPFVPDGQGCQSAVDNYKTANQIAEEGAALFNEGDKDAGLAKLDEAVQLLPNDANLRIMRGEAYLDLSRMEEACADLRLARRIALINWYNEVLPIICK